MFQLEGCPDFDDDLDDSTDEIIMAVKEDQSDSVTTKKRRTIRFRGFIGKKEIIILLDSDSVNTFVSDTVVSSLNLQTDQCEQLKFTTANGSLMQSDRRVSQLQWFIQSHTFSYNARVLPRKCSDMILGADWLEDHSPTWIH